MMSDRTIQRDSEQESVKLVRRFRPVFVRSALDGTGIYNTPFLSSCIQGFSASNSVATAV